MFKYIITALAISVGISSHAQPAFDIQGHRGARGLYPENTITGFIEAIKLGVNTLEMDVVITKDGKVVLSHDPTINCDICIYCGDTKGKKEYMIYRMDYDLIKTIDCGGKGNPKFPEQKKMFAVKPLLTDVIDSVESYLKQNHLPPVFYNIETKSTPGGDEVEHPAPDVFAKMLYDVLKQKNVLNKCIIQSFDPRTLEAIHKMDGNTTTALLVFNADSYAKNIKRLGFTPTIYSPNYMLVNDKLIKKCHAQKVKIIPWTVNEEDKMLKLKQQGVDGLITDYPDRAIKILR